MEKPIVIILKTRGGGYAKVMKDLEHKLKELSLQINYYEEREKRKQAFRNIASVFAKAMHQSLSHEELKKEMNVFAGENIDLVVLDEYDTIFKDCAESVHRTSDLIEELSESPNKPPLHGFKTEKYPYEDCATLSPKEFGMKKRGVKNFNKRRK